MRKLVVRFVGGLAMAAAAMASTPSGAEAGLTTFNFENVALRASDTQISNYMSSLYGSSVTVSRGQTDNNTTITIFNNTYIIDLQPWLGNTGRFLYADVLDLPGTSVDIAFNDVAISSLSFDGYVFRENFQDDFHFKAYDANGNLVTARTFQGYGGFNSGLIQFDRAVSMIRFSNNLIHDIGIDNLSVTAVPEPTTVAAGLLGISLTGMGLALRRRTRPAA